MPVALTLMLLAGAPPPSSVTGPLLKENIQRHFDLHGFTETWSCVTAEQTDAGIPNGKLTARFTIVADGSVREVSITGSTFNNPRLEACVKDVFSRVTFGSPKGGDLVLVEYPLEFVAEQRPLSIGDLGTKGGPGYAEAKPAGEPEPMIMGSLTKDTVKKVLHAHRAEVKACATAHPAADGSAPTGVVVIKFIVTEAGEVTTSRLERSSTQNEALEECVRAAALTWKFPRKKGTPVSVVTNGFRFPQ
jgi:TonB family protein